MSKGCTPPLYVAISTILPVGVADPITLLADFENDCCQLTAGAATGIISRLTAVETPQPLVRPNR